jgi:hypothetical protein
MSNDNAFRKLNQLVSELQRNIEQLGEGSLPVDQLEQMVNTTREMYERLVVIRHKVYDSIVNPIESHRELQAAQEEPSSPATPIAENNKAHEIIEQPINFRIDPLTEKTNQFNLLDAIEEASNTNAVTAMPEVIVNTPSSVSAPESLHERLAKSVGYHESVADKLENSPIADLKKAITLNQRFQFSKELFKGNNQDYELAIEKLNNGSREDAFNHIQNLKSKYTWSNESEIVADFIELVERRHL